MIHFILFTILIPSAFAKFLYQNVENHNPSGLYDVGPSTDVSAGYIIGDPLWVLRLNNEEWLNSKLRLGTSEEQEDFYLAVGPLIAKPRQPRIKKNDPELPSKTPQPTEQRSNAELKNDIMKLINKFVLSTSIEPDSYLREDEESNGLSIVLYFKGPISSVIVKSNDKQWHYVIKSSPFPDWFYERHDTFEAPLSIPEGIRNKFYSALYRLLKLMLYHPL